MFCSFCSVPFCFIVRFCSVAQPVVSNFGAIDALKLPNHTFQMTVSDHHPISLKSIKVIYGQLKRQHDSQTQAGGGGGDEFFMNLFFVFPPKIYDEVTKPQPFQKDGKTVDASATELWTNNIRQYALRCVTVRTAVLGDNSDRVS